ncbi:MAG: o-succinylbenzoate synthase, partial [Cyanobacteriota bacterium]
MAGVGGAVSGGDRLRLRWRPFSFRLTAPLQTAAGGLARQRGWLLRLETVEGAVGCGDSPPLGPGSIPGGGLERAGCGR